MKLDQLRKIIREEVRAAVKSELQDVINEAIKIASTPDSNIKPIAKPTLKSTNPKTGKKSLDEMIQMTQKSMTNEDYKTVFTGTSDMVTGMPSTATSMVNQMNVNAGVQPGLDISSLDFVKKAGKVFKAANEVQKSKQLV